MNIDVAKALDAYRKGDRLGAPWESGTAHWSPVTYEQIMARQHQFPHGTDESDIVDCFERFVSQYNYDGDTNDLLLSWARFHERNRRATSYGGTWKDYFATVKAMDRSGRLTVENLFRLSAERKPGGSQGNGCLPLSLPVYDYSKKIGVGSKEIVQLFFRLSHAHENALGCARYLCDLFAALEGGFEPLNVKSDCGVVECFLKNKEWIIQPDEFAKKHPNNMLCCETVVHALFGAMNADDEQDLILKIVSMGGDVDSVLAMALMIHHVVPNWKVKGGVM